MTSQRHCYSALTTDLYEVTMACGYFKAGITDHEAVFHVTFRENPFAGQFTVACGLATAIDFLNTFHFTDTEVDYLGSQRGNDGKPLFDSRFLDYLRGLQLACDLDAIPEGTLVFPNEPLVRIRGPIAQCQLLETALLNIFNFQSLIATKATRICQAAKGDPVIEFGLRRSQGVDGGLTAARAAYIGGCAGTSNLQAGQLVDLQNDFLPGGALAVPHGDEVIPLADELQSHFDLVAATKDWHPPDHGSFAGNHPDKKPGDRIILDGIEQILWPVHCVQNTKGAEFGPFFNTSRIAHVFHKGTERNIDSYSTFFDNAHRRPTGLAYYLEKRGINEIYLMGLALDYCVK